MSAALAAIEAGDSAAEHFAVIGDDWDAPARARALLDRLGLARVALDRRVGELSGGESVLAQARIQLDRRQRYGRKLTATTRAPKIIMSERKRQAQVSAGKHRNLQLDRVRQAADRLAEAQGAVRDDDEIRVDLPATAVPARRTVLVLDGARPRFGPAVTLHLRGPERVALVGRNGAGKTTLLRTITGELPPAAGEVRLEVPARLLPQRLDVLDPELSVAANAARFAPRASPNAIRASLARLLFPGTRADQVVAMLSGGELFRATLAALLLAEPAPQLLLLDEPTNSLDRPSVRQLTEALRGYRGALLVASHDVPFLRGLELTRWLRHDDALRDIDPL